MKKRIAAAVSAVGLLLASMSPLATAAGVDDVYKSLRQAMPSLSKDDISPSPVEGIYEVNRGMSFFYATSDGRYVFSGDLVDVASGTSITENTRKSLRLQQLAQVDSDSLILFPAEKEKYRITVFTDIDCGYCRKLHREMADYNARGITVAYLFYPRSGPNTPSFTKAESVWCAADRNVAMTSAKQGATIKTEKCSNPIRQQFELGQSLGVRGTPALVLPDGSMQPGYLPADRLLGILEEGA